MAFERCLGLGHNARKSRKSHKSRKSFGGIRLNHVNSRKSRKCCQPGRVFTRVFLRFQRGCFCSFVCPYARSFFLPSFLQCMAPAVCFFLVSNLFVAWRTIHFLFAFQPSQSMSLPYESMRSYETCGSNFKPQTSKQSVHGLFFQKKKKVRKTVTHTPRRRHDEQLFAYLAPLPAMHIVPTRLRT